MPMELKKEAITLNHKTDHEMTQILLEGDVIVPDMKPDILNILRTEGKVTIEEVKPSESRISFSGYLKVAILYQAQKSERMIHSMTASLPMEDVMNMDGITPASQVTLDAELEHLECKLVNDRKVSIKAIIRIDVDVEDQITMEVLKDVENDPQVQVLKGSLVAENTVENKKDRFAVKESVTVPAGMPNILELLQTDVSIGQKEVKPMDGRVMLKGILLVSILYVGDTDESIVETIESEIPFNGYIEAKDVTDQMLAKANLSVENQTVQVAADQDGEERILECEITVGTDLKVTDNRQTEIVEDLYGLNKPLQVEKSSVQYPQFVARNKNTGAVKETIELEGTYPDMMRVLKVWGTVTVNDVTVSTDQVKVQGDVNLEILYIAADDRAPVQVASHTVPFEQVIETKGAQEGMDVDVTADIESISFNMLSDREVEVRITLGFDAFVTQEMNGEIITEVDYAPEDTIGGANANVIIYVVQKGDTLWLIAKKYNTTVDELIQLNELENPDRIYPGQKMLILKKYTE